MSRPAFSLSDAQARDLMGRLDQLQHSHPLDRRDHRAFVGGFLRAVHQVTGHLHSPAIYRRLLAVYAPDRRPSTATLALEKEALADELTRATRATEEVGALPSLNLACLVRDVVAEALARFPTPRIAPADGARAQVEFLQSQLAKNEQALREARHYAATLDAELRAERERSSGMSSELEQAKAGSARQALLLEKLTTTMDGDRAFALKAIDEVRGETRAWKERCARAEMLLREEKLLLETFRQLAYQRGAAIPRELQPGSAE